MLVATNEGQNVTRQNIFVQHTSVLQTGRVPGLKKQFGPGMKYDRVLGPGPVTGDITTFRKF